MERSTQGTSDQSLNSFQWASLCSELAKCWCVIIDWTLPRRGPRKTKARGQLNLQSRVLKISQQHSLTFISHTQVCLSMTDTEQMHTIRPVHHSCLGRFFCIFYPSVRNQFRSNCRWKSIIKILFSNMSSAIYLVLVWTSFYASGLDSAGCSSVCLMI